MKGYSKYRGNYARNQAYPPINEREGFIINMDDKTGAGTHWVAVTRIADDIIYFDSFGILPPKEFFLYARNNGYKILSFQPYQLQYDQSNLCGYFCCFFLKKIMQGKSPEEALFEFTLKPSHLNRSKIYKK